MMNEQEREANMLAAAFNAQKTCTVDSNAVIGQLGPQTYQPKPPPKRTLTEQLNFNAEMLAVLQKELKELFDRLSPLMIPSPDAAEQEKELAELNGEVINRLIEQSYQITRLIGNVRQAQGNLQL